MAAFTSSASNGFITNFNSMVPHIYITAEVDSEQDFDQATLRRWRDQGFNVTFLPYGQGGSAHTRELQNIDRTLGVGHAFAIIAYGDAATACLETFRRPSAKLVALVAYYPGAIPDPQTAFPTSTRVLVHLAGGVVGVTRNAELLGVQGKRRTRDKSIPPGTGSGGMLKLAYPAYRYDLAEPGFAEHDLPEFQSRAESLAWSRTLDCIRKAFRVEVDIEKTWEEHISGAYKTRNLHETMHTFTETPYVNNVPTLTGAQGRQDVERFFRDFVIPANPASLDMQLVSRTIGVDRIVDETVVSFVHTNHMPWMLPGIPPTHNPVKVALVNVVTFRGAKIHQIQQYWDQSSVLSQIGQLDAETASPAMEKLGVDLLPIADQESALKVLDPQSEPSNDMIDEW